jgi:hypothetical protein
MFANYKAAIFLKGWFSVIGHHEKETESKWVTWDLN